MITSDLEHITFQELWTHALIGIAIVEESGKFLFANPNFCKIVEYTEAELQDRLFKDITHPEDVSADEKMHDRLADDDNNDSEYLMKKRYITKTGRVVWVVLKVNRIQKPDGKFAYFLSQVSELVELLPPKVGRELPTSETISKRLGFNWTKRNIWWILPIIGALAIFTSQVIKYLG